LFFILSVDVLVPTSAHPLLLLDIKLEGPTEYVNARWM
jgi:hypothetical protein